MKVAVAILVVERAAAVTVVTVMGAGSEAARAAERAAGSAVAATKAGLRGVAAGLTRRRTAMGHRGSCSRSSPNRSWREKRSCNPFCSRLRRNQDRRGQL